jgi:hypothetical protein
MSPASASGSECSYGVRIPPTAGVPLAPIQASLKVAFEGYAQLAAQVLGFAGTAGAHDVALEEWGAEVEKAVKAAGLGAVPGMSVLGGWLFDELPGWSLSEPGLAALRRVSDAIIMLFRHTFPDLWESVTQVTSEGQIGPAVRAHLAACARELSALCSQLKGGRHGRPGRGGPRPPAPGKKNKPAAPPPRDGRGGRR